MAPLAPVDPSERFVRWTPTVAADDPALAEAVAAFVPMDVPSGVAVASWLKERALAQPGSATPYLMVRNGRVAGFYALAAASVELRGSHRNSIGAELPPTVPAYLIAQLGRASWSEPGSGRRLLAHAMAKAREASLTAAAVALVVDPFDDGTAELWRRWGFRTSSMSIGDTRRMWMRLYGS